MVVKGVLGVFFKNKLSTLVQQEHFTDGIYLCESGWEVCNPGHSCIALIRDFYLLHFVASGKGVFKAGGVSHELGAGQGFIIRPGEVTEYYADMEEPWEYCWFGINGDRAEEILGLAGISEGQSVMDFSGTSLIHSVENIQNAVMTSQNPAITGTAMALLTLNEMIETMGGRKEKYPSKDYVRTAVSFIEYNYSRDISVAGLAEMVSVNRSHFYRIFNKDMGVSPQEYIISCRMRNAERLLRDSDMTISEIAFAVGYQDAVNFSRIFKRRYGVSPGEFRKTELVEKYG